MPNNALVKAGFGGLVSFDMFVSPIIALIIFLYIYKNKKLFHYKWLMFLNLIVGFALFIFPLVIISGAFIGVMLGRVSV